MDKYLIKFNGKWQLLKYNEGVIGEYDTKEQAEEERDKLINI